MQRKIIFLLNPTAGTSKKSRIRNIIQERMTAHQDIAFEILPTSANGDYAHIRTKIETEHIREVIIAGGDGTINSVVNSLRDLDLNFGLIPCGSGNGLALTAGIPKNTSKALDLIFSGTPRYVDAFSINSQFSCMLSGLGFDAQVAHDFAKQHTRGLATYIKQTCANFIKAHPYTFEITTPESKIRTEAYFVSIANSNQFGNQFTIAPQASLTDGLLDIVIVQRMSKAKMLISVLKQVTNGDAHKHPYKKQGVIYFQTRKLTIKNVDAAPLHIDGDPVATAADFAIEIIPRAFRLIQPAS